MDGNPANFLRDLPSYSTLDEVFGLGRSDGILYVEDFDAPLPAEPAQAAEAALPEPEAPAISAEDVAAAREAGRREGLQSALADAHLLQAQLQAAATQALTDALMASRATLERVAQRQAEDTAATVLAILRAAVPNVMARHAKSELRAVVDTLLPGLRSEPELRVRTHPDLADFVRETLVGLLETEGGVIAVAADAALAPGDIQIGWPDGSARRDCSAIYTEIAAALAPLGLPPLEEICCGNRA